MKYELSEDQLNCIKKICDLAIKAYGVLHIGDLLKEIEKIFSSQIKENNEKDDLNENNRS